MAAFPQQNLAIQNPTKAILDGTGLTPFLTLGLTRPSQRTRSADLRADVKAPGPEYLTAKKISEALKGGRCASTRVGHFGLSGPGEAVWLP